MQIFVVNTVEDHAAGAVVGAFSSREKADQRISELGLDLKKDVEIVICDLDGEATDRL